eukprot:scaffold632326_cov48-Prasinocladus_malaysianus.AAC.2
MLCCDVRSLLPNPPERRGMSDGTGGRTGLATYRTNQTPKSTCRQATEVLASNLGYWVLHGNRPASVWENVSSYMRHLQVSCICCLRDFHQVRILASEDFLAVLESYLLGALDPVLGPVI